MRTKATVLSFTLLSLATVARAADDTGPVMSGFVETTYNYNTNRSPSNANVGHLFDAQSNTFALNMAQLLIQGNPRGDKDVSYTFRLDYGTDVGVLDPSAGMITVEEAYGTWRDPGSKIGVKIGKFVTYEGIEVIEAIADPTITRGLLFSLAEPFTHTGAVATYVNGKLDFALGLVNGWDLVTDNNSGKTLVFKGTYNGGKDLVITLSGLYGPEKAGAPAFPASNDDNRLSLDLTGVTKVVENLDLNFQLNYGTEEHSAVSDANKTAKWYGFGIQPVYHFDKKFSIGARFELFSDKDGARTSVDNEKITTFSIVPAYQVTDHFLARAELRYDHSNNKVFDDRDGLATKKSQTEIVLETIFSF
jgi:hypothetical protein